MRDLWWDEGTVVGRGNCGGMRELGVIRDLNVYNKLLSN